MIPPWVAMNHQRLIRGGGPAPRVRDKARLRDPGGGGGIDHFLTRKITDEVFQTVEQSGGRPCLSSPGGWPECAQRTMLEDIQIQECPHDDDLEIRPRVDTIRRLEDRVPAKRIVSLYTPMPVPPADRPQLGPWRVAVVRVEETPVGDASGTEPSCATTDRKSPPPPQLVR